MSCFYLADENILKVSKKGSSTNNNDHCVPHSTCTETKSNVVPMGRLVATDFLYCICGVIMCSVGYRLSGRLKLVIICEWVILGLLPWGGQFIGTRRRWGGMEFYALLVVT